MKFQIQFARKNKKNTIRLSSAEFAHGMASVIIRTCWLDTVVNVTKWMMMMRMMMIWCFISLSTLCKSYGDDGRVIMKSSVQSSGKHAYIMLTPLNPTFIW